MIPYCLWLLFAFNDKCLLVLFSLIFFMRNVAFGLAIWYVSSSKRWPFDF